MKRQIQRTRAKHSKHRLYEPPVPYVHAKNSQNQSHSGLWFNTLTGFYGPGSKLSRRVRKLQSASINTGGRAGVHATRGPWRILKDLSQLKYTAKWGRWSWIMLLTGEFVGGRLRFFHLCLSVVFKLFEAERNQLHQSQVQVPAVSLRQVMFIGLSTQTEL